MSTFTNITKILKQSLKTHKAKSIFHVVLNFANILTVKIVKKIMQAKEIFIFQHLEAAILNVRQSR